MKRYFMFMALAALTLAGCKKDDTTTDPTTPPTQPEGPKYDVEITIDNLWGEYYGNYAGENYNYMLYLEETGGIWNIDIYSDVPVGTGETILPLGTYTYDAEDTYAAGTFSAEYSYYQPWVDDEEGQPIFFKEATVTVTENKIDLVGTMSDDKLYHVVYNGSLLLGMPEEVYSTLTDDVTLSVTNGLCLVEPYGDYYEVGMDNNIIYIYEDYENGTGHFFMLETLTDPSTSPFGNHTVMDIEMAETIENYVFSGIFSDDLYGAWYINQDTEDLAPLKSGNINIAGTTDNCTITFDCKDDAGNAIKGTFACQLFVLDDSYGVAPRKAAPAKVAKTNTLKKTPAKAKLFKK